MARRWGRWAPIGSARRRAWRRWRRSRSCRGPASHDGPAWPAAASVPRGVSPDREALTIRPFRNEDAKPVRDLFITVNRGLAPPGGEDAFEAYIARSLAEEIDRIPDYYGQRDG